MTERPRASSIDDFKRWINLRINFGLNSYVLHHYDITFTYSMFTSPITRFRQSNITFYCIKRPVHIILRV